MQWPGLAVCLPSTIQRVSLVHADDIKIFDKDLREIKLTRKNIAWPQMAGNKFKTINGDKQWVDIEDERFINWMMPNTYPSVFKGWFRLSPEELSIPPGEYTLQVTNHLDASLFGGSKYFGFEEYSQFGAKNLPTLLVLTLVFIVSTAFTVAFCVLVYKEKNVDQACKETDMEASIMDDLAN